MQGLCPLVETCTQHTCHGLHPTSELVGFWEWWCSADLGSNSLSQQVRTAAGVCPSAAHVAGEGRGGQTFPTDDLAVTPGGIRVFTINNDYLAKACPIVQLVRPRSLMHDYYRLSALVSY